jgi:hypothetical protein
VSQYFLLLLISFPQLRQIFLGDFLTPFPKVSFEFIFLLFGRLIPKLFETFLIFDPEHPYNLPIDS